MTAHTDETIARSWTMLGKKVGKHKLVFASDTVKAKGKEKERPLGSVKVCLVLSTELTLIELVSVSVSRLVATSVSPAPPLALY